MHAQMMIMGTGGLLALLVYFLPAMVAISRHHFNAMAIFLTNLLLGWTVIGWIIALIWAFTNAPAYKDSAAPPQKKGRAGRLILLLLLVVVILVGYWLSGADGVMIPQHSSSTIRTGVPVPADELFGK